MTPPPRLSPRLQAVVEALPLQPDARVLEIGCGPGAAARAIAARLTTGRSSASHARRPRTLGSSSTAATPSAS
jgi:protein-L-isoaspartate O-methyltransferase